MASPPRTNSRVNAVNKNNVFTALIMATYLDRRKISLGVSAERVKLVRQGK